MAYGRGQGVLDGGEVSVYRRRMSRSRASGASQTCHLGVSKVVRHDESG